MRIVSLLPSATEIICSLGLRDELVGVSHECDFPQGVDLLPTVTASTIAKDASSLEIDTQVREQLRESTALYELDLELLTTLQPDLIVTQALCDVCAVSADDVEAALCSIPGNPQLINLEPSNLADMFATVERVAAAAGCLDRGEVLNETLRSRIDRVRELVKARAEWQPRVAQLEWLDPLFDAGHWTPELVELAGGTSVTGQACQPSSTLSWEALVEAKPDALSIACCGFGMERTLADLPVLFAHQKWRNLAASIGDHLYIADGNHYFNRPGPRLIDSLEIIADALHPHAGILPADAAHRARQIPTADRPGFAAA